MLANFSYLELVAYFQSLGDYRIECYNECGKVYQISTPHEIKRYEDEYILNNGNKRLKTLQANKNNMLVLKRKLECKKCNLERI